MILQMGQIMVGNIVTSETRATRATDGAGLDPGPALQSGRRWSIWWLDKRESINAQANSQIEPTEVD